MEAQTPLGPAFLVNPESVGAQDSPDLQFDGAGRLWFVWTDLIGLEPESDRVVARALSPQGELGPTSVLVDTSDIPATPALDPLIAPLRDGGIYLIYSRPNPDGFDQIWGQQLDSNGKPLGERISLAPPPPAATDASAVAMLPEGGFALMTSGVPCLTCPRLSHDNINARILAPDGSPAGPFFQVSRKSELVVPGARSLAVDDQGNLNFVWAHAKGDPDARDYSDIRGRRFSSTGKPIGQEFTVNTTLRGTQYAPSVAADAEGNFVVVWQNRFPGGLLRSIFAQRFSKTGQKVGPEFRVNEDRVEKDFVPVVAMDHDGNFAVVWQSFSPARPQCVQVRARLYRRDGTPAGPEFPVAPGDAACGEAPKVAFGPNGTFAVVWEVEQGFSPDTGTDFDVYAARFSAR
ncbi:MAG TPA: hypothetical protein VGM86_12875 [Thermoanaerobaculia bacterium]